MPKYWIVQPRFVQQVGDVEPRYIAASPNTPVLIDVPFEVTPEQQKKLGYTPLETPPEKPRPQYATPAGPPVQRAPDVVKGKRLADQ